MHYPKGRRSPCECGALSSNWYWVTNDVSPTFQKLGIFPDHPTVARDLELKETIVAVRPIITFAYLQRMSDRLRTVDL